MSIARSPLAQRDIIARRSKGKDARPHSIFSPTRLQSVAAALGLAGLVLCGSGQAEAACTVGFSDVTCGNTTTTDTLYNGSGSNHRYYFSYQPGAITGDITGAVDGFGFAMGTFDASNVTITNTGSVAVDAGNTPTQNGSAALAVNGFGGVLSYTGSGTVTNFGTGDGIGFVNTAGSVIITTNNTVSSANGAGIAAQTNTGTITIGGSGAVSGAVGVNAVATGAGNVTVNGSGTITGTPGVGVNATSQGGNVNVATTSTITGATGGVNATTNGAGTVQVTTGGTITATGNNGIGINSSSQNGATTIALGHDVTATGTNTIGVNATATGSGPITITKSAGTVTATSSGVTMTGAGGDVAFTQNGGGLAGGANAVTASNTGIGAVSVFLNAGSVSSTSGTLIKTTAVDGLTTISSSIALATAANGIDALATGTGQITATLADGLAAAGTALNLNSSGGGTITANINGGMLSTTTAGNNAIAGTNATGLFDINNNTTVSGLVNVAALSTSQFQNNGTWNAFGALGSTSSYGGQFFNNAAGVVNMQDNDPTDRVTVNSYTGAGPTSQLLVDINPGTGQGDRLVTLDATNASVTTIYFNKMQDGLTGGIVVVHQANDIQQDERFLAGTVLAPSGFFTYEFAKIGSDWVVRSAVDAVGAASIVTNVTTALSTLASAFHEPASNFVAYRKGSPDQIACGLWARAGGGRFNVDASSSLNFVGQHELGDVGSRQRLSYQGGQAGFDCAALNIGASGWNGHLGITGGEVDGDVVQLNGIGRTDLNIPFAGAYAFLTNGALTFDATVRHDFNHLKFTNQLAGLSKTEVDGDANTIGGSALYRADLGGGLFVSPNTSLTYTRYNLDDFAFQSGNIPGVISAGSDQSLLGKLGVEISFVQQIAPKEFIVPYVGLNAWRNFDNKTDLSLIVTDAGSGTITADTTGPASFGQYMAGLSYANTAAGIAGYVQGSWRQGSDISGGSVGGGGSVSF